MKKNNITRTITLIFFISLIACFVVFKTKQIDERAFKNLDGVNDPSIIDLAGNIGAVTNNTNDLLSNTVVTTVNSIGILRNILNQHEHLKKMINPTMLSTSKSVIVIDQSLKFMMEDMSKPKLDIIFKKQKDSPAMWPGSKSATIIEQSMKFDVNNKAKPDEYNFIQGTKK